MSFTEDTAAIAQRFSEHIKELTRLISEAGISNPRQLVSVYWSDLEFRRRWLSVWGQVADTEGGKLSLATVGVIAGAAMGGAGIAVLGTAFGLPLALVLGLGGLLAGNEVDSWRQRRKANAVSIRLSGSVYGEVEAVAAGQGLSPDELVELVLRSALPDWGSDAEG